MKFEALVAPTIKDLFTEKMIGLILSGKLEVGQRLPAERELAAEMKVSKTIVHSGLTELERIGFVSIIPRKGTFVANYAENGTQETLNALLKYNGGTLDRHTVESMFEFRLALETAIFQRFAKEHSEENAKRLRAMVADIRAMARDVEKYTAEDLAEEIFQMHHAISVCSGNNVFPLVLNAFRKVSIVFWENGIRMYGREESALRAQMYLEKLLEGDTVASVQILRDDIEFYLKNAF